MFNIFNSPLDVIVAPGRDRAAMSIFGDFCRGDWIRARFIPGHKIFSMAEDRKIRRDRAAQKSSTAAMVPR